MRMPVKSILTLVIVSLLWQCNKTEDPEPKNSDIITIRNSKEYVHDFKISGDEEGATIKVQAKHSQVSELTRNATTNWSVVYTYKPNPDYLGKDSVEIETCTGGNGIECTDIEVVKMVFEVIE